MIHRTKGATKPGRRITDAASGRDLVRPGPTNATATRRLGLLFLFAICLSVGHGERAFAAGQGQSELAVGGETRAAIASNPLAGPTATTETSSVTKALSVENYGKLPLHFEPNRGQTDARVKFLSRGNGYTLYLTPSEAVLALRGPENGLSAENPHAGAATPGPAPGIAGSVLRLRLFGGNPEPEIVGLEELPGKSNYFIGRDPKTWRTNVPTYAKVAYRDIYPGIDLIFYGRQRQLEYDFVVAPGADPGVITLAFEGADKLEIDRRGNLVIEVAGAEVVQYAPVLFQESNGARQPVRGRYLLKGARRVGFAVAAYDTGKSLRIDPVLAYSTYLGGSENDRGTGIAVDAGADNIYVTGWTVSADFPTENPLDSSLAGFDAFVTKLNVGGTALVYSTFLGGGSLDEGRGIAVDGAGNAYVTGKTQSVDFPTTVGAFRTTQEIACGGGLGQIPDRPCGDAFVTKLNADGSALVYSTFLGGAFVDEGFDIAVDAAGNAYVTGRAQSSDFPTVNPIQAARLGDWDAFVTKLNSAGSALVYSTYLGGLGRDHGNGIAVDAAGNAYVTGETNSGNFPTVNPVQAVFGGGAPPDAFVTKLNSAGSALVYSTYLGGLGRDHGNGIAVDAGESAYVTGTTMSSNFPTANPLQAVFVGDQDAFVTKLNSAGSALVYSTYLGGGSLDEGQGIAVDAAGNAYVTGETASADFPLASPLRATNEGIDVFVTKLDPAGSALVYSTFLGGAGTEFGNDIAVDTAGNAYVTGFTLSPNFPTVGSLDSSLGDGLVTAFSDAFVAKIAGVGGNGLVKSNPMPWLLLLLED